MGGAVPLADGYLPAAYKVGCGRVGCSAAPCCVWVGRWLAARRMLACRASDMLALPYKKKNSDKLPCRRIVTAAHPGCGRRVHRRRGADGLWPHRLRLLGLPEPGKLPLVDLSLRNATWVISHPTSQPEPRLAVTCFLAHCSLSTSKHPQTGLPTRRASSPTSSPWLRASATACPWARW